MAQILDHRLDVHGNQRLILDDEHLRRNLLGDVSVRLVEKLVEFVLIDTENVGCLGAAELLDEDEQERLARKRRNRLQVARRTVRKAFAAVAAQVYVDRRPQRDEHVVEGGAKITAGWKRRRVGYQCFKHRGDIGIPACL